MISFCVCAYASYLCLSHHLMPQWQEIVDDKKSKRHTLTSEAKNWRIHRKRKEKRIEKKIKMKWGRTKRNRRQQAKMGKRQRGGKNNRKEDRQTFVYKKSNGQECINFFASVSINDREQERVRETKWNIKHTHTKCTHTQTPRISHTRQQQPRENVYV